MNRAIATSFLAVMLPLVSVYSAATAAEPPVNPADSPASCAELEQVADTLQAEQLDDPDTLELMGDLYRCQGNMSSAIASYTDAIAAYDATDTANLETPTIYFKLAQVQAFVDNPEAALASFREGISRDPLYGYLPLFSDRQYSPLGEPITDGSMRGNPYSAPVTAEESVEASAYFELGRRLEELGALTEAVEAYQQAIELSPNFAHAYNALGYAMFGSFIYENEAAIAALETALQLDPDLVWAHYNRGYALAWRGDSTRSFAEFRQVVDYHTGLDTVGEPYKDAIAWRMVGDVYMDQGNPGPAVDAYQQATWLDPDFVPGHTKLGEAFLMLGDMDNAITEFSVALAQLPESEVAARADLYHNLGTAYWQSEQWDLARAALQTALSLNPDLITDIESALDYINSRPSQ